MEQIRKQKRLKPWVMYEQNHSLSTGPMDWTKWLYSGKEHKQHLLEGFSKRQKNNKAQYLANTKDVPHRKLYK